MVLLSDVAVGVRLQIGRDRATVRYVGPVDSQVGDWVGLEWDDPSRGKHDGTTGGRQYFVCGYAPGSGTFVRLSKLLPTVQLPITMLQALRQRYQGAAMESHVHQAGDGSAANGFRGLRGVEAELVGQEDVLRRQGRLEQLQAAVLADSCVSSAGQPGQLAAAAPALLECDLTGNLLPDWAAVVAVLRELPHLRVLNLTASRLTQPSAGLAAHGSFSALRTLVLNRCCIQRWDEVLTIGAAFPDLRELHLAGNGLDALRPAASDQASACFGSLQVLDLDENQLSDWAEVQTLSQLPSLQRLSLTGNSILAISTAATGQGQGGFPALHALLLGDNGIASWASVDALTSLPSVREARLSGNSALGTDQTQVRSEVIARVGGLTLLNGSEVHRYERRDSELQYLRRVLGDLAALADGQQRAALEGSNPRLPDLAEKYGMMAGLTPSTGIATAGSGGPGGGTALASTMLRLKLTLSGSDGGPKTVTKRLPSAPPGQLLAIRAAAPSCVGSMTIGNLRVFAERLFRLRGAQQALVLRLPGDEQLRSLGNDDTQPLSFYEVEDGSEILISPEDLDARAAEMHAAQQAHAASHQRRMDQQLKEGDALLQLRHGEQAVEV